MALPQKDLIVLLSGPIILLIRFIICNGVPSLQDTWVCEAGALVSMIKLHQPWEAFYALVPKANPETLRTWTDPASVVLLLACFTVLILLWFGFTKFAPSTPTVYIQPTAGLKDLGFRFVSMFMRSSFAVVYVWKFWQEYPSIVGTNEDGSIAVTYTPQPDPHKFAMQAIVSHYIVRGVEAALLRRYSAPFFPPQLSQPLPVVFGVAVYLYHYFLILVHFQWMAGANYGSHINEEWMYFGYAISVFGQVLMLKQADTIPKSTLRSGFVWRGEVVSWIGIGFISQHPGVWILVLTMVPFAYCEELLEMWTGQRYARLCTPLRSSNAVLFKDVPGLAEEVAPALLEAGSKTGPVDLCVVRPRSTVDKSDVYLIFANDLDAGMAKSTMDGKTFEGWRANALQRKY
jgi:hypothetical protein